MNLGGTIEPIYNAVGVGELAIDKGALITVPDAKITG